MSRVKYEDFLKAMEEASKVLGSDPAYYGKEGSDEVERQLKVLGYSKEDLIVSYSKEVDKIESNVTEEQRNEILKLENAIISIRDELQYALYSNKSEDVKRYYLENAIKIADRVICIK